MSDDVFMYFIIYALAFAGAVALTRWIFGIGTIIKHTKAQTTILKLMAERAGVDADVLKSVTKDIDEKAS